MSERKPFDAPFAVRHAQLYEIPYRAIFAKVFMTLFGMEEQQAKGIVDGIEELCQSVPQAKSRTTLSMQVVIKRRGVVDVNITLPPTEDETHFEKIIMGACRKTHMECLLEGRPLTYKDVERKQATILFPKESAGVDVNTLFYRRKRAREIFNRYYNSNYTNKKARLSNDRFTSLIKAYPDLNMEGAAEFLSIVAGDNGFRISNENASWLADFFSVLTSQRGES